MNKIILFICICLYFTSQPLYSADLYRCGNSFQDTPCVGAAKSKVIVTNASPSNSNQQTEAVDKDCLQQGESAKKIMWMREVGKTAEDQMSAAPDSSTKKLIAQVYQHRGSSLQVKAAIERECMQQKERDLLAAKMMIEAQHLRNGTSSADPSTISNQKDNLTENSTGQQTDNKALSNDAKCNSYKSEQDAISLKRRKGGSAGFMEKLKQRQLEIEVETKSLAC